MTDLRPRSDTLQGAHGIRLRVLHWEAVDPPPDPTPLLLVHGFAEHAGRYGEFASYLASRGRPVVGFDQRGHGETQGRRGRLERFDDLLEDLDRVVEGVARGYGRERSPFVLGHSMGGLVLLRWLQTRRPPIPGAVVSAPWLGTAVELPWWLRALLPLAERLVPDMTLRREIRPEELTSDPERQRAYREDPLVHRRISPGLFEQVREAQDRALEASLDPALPVLFLLPQEDALVDEALNERYAGSRTGDEVEVRLLEGMRHEPFQETDRARVYEEVARWLERHEE